MSATETNTRDYDRVAEAIRFLHARADTQPTLTELAEHLGLSGPYMQRVFRRFAGVSPKRYVQQLTIEAAKERMRASQSVLDTTFDVGLSSGGRLHDLFVSMEGMTPGEFSGGKYEVTYGITETPLGACRVAWTPRGICAVDFLDADVSPNDLPAEPGARDDHGAQARAAHLFDATPTPLHVRGTNWQIQVWRALLRIPEGHVVSYGDIAAHLGKPASTRAVASAIARNPVAIWIPCHRVLRQSGAISGYRWGPTRKQALLAREWSRR